MMNEIFFVKQKQEYEPTIVKQIIKVHFFKSLVICDCLLIMVFNAKCQKQYKKQQQAKSQSQIWLS